MPAARLRTRVGWRGTFVVLAPIVAMNLAWQWVSLPAMPPEAAKPVGTIFGLLKRRERRASKRDDH